MDLQKFIEYKEEYGYFKLMSIDWSYIKLVFSNRCIRMNVYFTEMGDDGILGMLEMYHALKERKPFNFVAYDDGSDYWVLQIKNYNSGYYWSGDKFENVVLSVQEGYWHAGIEHGAFFYQEYPVEYLECLFEKFFKDVSKHPNYPVKCYWMDEHDIDSIKALREMVTTLKVPDGWHVRTLEDLPALVKDRKELFEEIQ